MENRLHHREFRLSFGGGKPTERLLLPGGEHMFAPELTLVEPELGVFDHVRNLIGGAVRVLGRVLYLSPALIVLKLILSGFNLRISDYVIPAFATLLCLFFAALCLWVAVSLPWWFFRGKRGLLTFTPPPAADVAEVIVRGVVMGLEPGATVVLTSTEEKLGGLLDRVVVGECFAVVPEEGEPAIVVPRRTPFVEGGPLSVGDRVEVRGVRTGTFDNRERFDLDGQPAGLADDGKGDGPYREAPAGPALRLGDDATVRLLIRKL